MNEEIIVELTNRVSDYVSKNAACAASYIRGVRGVDPEVDLIIMLRPMYDLAINTGMHDVAASLTEAIEKAYDAFVNAEFSAMTQGDDAIEWL